MSASFESSARGALADDAILECGVCWWPFDPAIGDDIGGVEPGTAFSALPSSWRCPSCDAAKSAFMLPEGGIAAPSAKPVATIEERIEALLAAYEKAEDSMLGLPVHNKALKVGATAFRECGHGFAGVVVTPWCMNIVVLPRSMEDAPAGAVGSVRNVSFPSGRYAFTMGHLEGAGALETCSLFSPMEVFDDQAVAMAVAEEAIGALFTPIEDEAPPPVSAEPVSRRVLFTVGKGAR